MLDDDRADPTDLPGVDPAIATALMQFTRTIKLKRGHELFVEGDVGAAAYLVTAGRLKITRQTTSGGTGILAVLGRGHVLGELSLLDGAPRSATAQAITSVTLEELTHDRLDQLLHDRPEVALWMLQQAARRLRNASDVVADLVFSDVPARVAQILVNLTREFGVEQSVGVVVDHGLTQLELAQLAGAARESVNKALASFVDRNWVTLTSRSILIHNLEALQRRAG